MKRAGAGISRHPLPAALIHPGMLELKRADERWALRWRATAFVEGRAIKLARHFSGGTGAQRVSDAAAAST